MKKIFIALLLILFSNSVILPNINREQVLINHINKSIQNAEKSLSKLNTEVLELDGMSSSKVRHFLNNLCCLPDTNYLEIGVWKGSTFISALYNNANITNAIAIENWSQFGSPKNEFLNSALKLLEPNSFLLFEMDAYSIDVKKVFKAPINIFFYDGDHSLESQFLAFVHYNDILAETFIAIVDDWNELPTKEGTKKAFNHLRYQIIKDWTLHANFNGDRQNWWNGLYVALIKKTIKQDSSWPFISGDTFKSFCKFYVDHTNTKLDPLQINTGDLVFVHPEYLNYFFSEIHPKIVNKYILITHNEDDQVPGKFSKFLEDETLVAWFGENATLNHKKMIPIPIGILNENINDDWKKAIGGVSSFRGTLEKILAKNKNIEKDILLYLNCEIQTNQEERKKVYEIFQDKNYCFKGARKPLDQYLGEISRSKFVLSPAGKGLDCIRTWESLYVGSYPIVKSSLLDDLYRDLPVVIVKEWNEISEDFLNQKYQELNKKKFNTGKLYMHYWLELIQSYQDKIRLRNARLIIKIPTRERPEQFFKILDKYYRNLSNKYSYKFIITCDLDDKSMNNQTVINKLKNYPNLEFYFCKNKTKIDAYNNNLDKKLEEFDILLAASDDAEPVIFGYDAIIIKTLIDNFPDYDGVINFNDGFIGEECNTLPVIGNKFYNRFGYIYYPEYKSFWCDKELTLVSRILKKEFVSNKVVIIHKNPANDTHIPNDNLYIQNGKWFDVDRKKFEERAARNFDLQIN